MENWLWLLSVTVLLAATSSAMALGTRGRVVEIGPDYFIIEVNQDRFPNDPARMKMTPDDELKKGIKRVSRSVFAELKVGQQVSVSSDDKVCYRIGIHGGNRVYPAGK